MLEQALRGDRTARGKGAASVPSPRRQHRRDLPHSHETTEAFLERFGALLLQYYGLSGCFPISVRMKRKESLKSSESDVRKQQAHNHGVLIDSRVMFFRSDT